jgi:hypothetical protein
MMNLTYFTTGIAIINRPRELGQIETPFEKVPSVNFMIPSKKAVRTSQISMNMGLSVTLLPLQLITLAAFSVNALM